jgi:RIO-like serine/threonine protein kinase
VQILSGKSVSDVKPTLLKADELGRIEIIERDGVRMIRRDIRAARWWARAFANRAAAREARALAKLDGIDGVPALLGWDGRELLRSYIAGFPMQQAKPRDVAYYRDALRLLAQLHRRGIVHNDLAKEPNWLVRADGRPALGGFPDCVDARPARAAIPLAGARRLASFAQAQTHVLRSRTQHATTRDAENTGAAFAVMASNGQTPVQIHCKAFVRLLGQ